MRGDVRDPARIFHAPNPPSHRRHRPQELRLTLAPLLERLSPTRWQQFVAVLSGRLQRFPFARERIVGRLPLRFGLHCFAAPTLRRYIQEQRIDVVHAWSTEAAYLATMVGPAPISAREDSRRSRPAQSEIGAGLPVVLSRWDPAVTSAQARKLPALARLEATGVLCHSAMAQRRLVENGLPLERCAVIRPGVDFAVINRLKQTNKFRQELDLEPDHFVILMPAPPSPAGGHFFGAWAVESAARMQPRLALLLPGISRERDKIVAYFRSAPHPLAVRACGEHHCFEQLLGLADVLLVPAVGDISATPIAWAMACGVPILGCANYCVTEFIADGHNGHLVRPNEPMLMVGKLLDIARDRESGAELCDRARAQAFECFGMTRYVQQVEHAYENLLAGKPIGADLTDSGLTT